MEVQRWTCVDTGNVLGKCYKLLIVRFLKRIVIVGVSSVATIINHLMRIPMDLGRYSANSSETLNEIQRNPILRVLIHPVLDWSSEETLMRSLIELEISISIPMHRFL